MNIHQLKQWLLNNLWNAENSHRNSRRLHMGELFLGGILPVKVSTVEMDDHIIYDQMQTILTDPPTGKVWGIDGSHWNRPPIAMQRMKDIYNMAFVILKGCDGTLNSNYYPEHRAAAKAAQLPFGMYAWLYQSGKVSIDAQVNAWLARYNEDVPPLGLFIDAEWTYYGGQPANPSANDLRAACDKWYAKTGKRATVYTAKGYADQYLKGFDWTKEPLWIANYGVSVPALPTGATAYKFWQFTSTLDGHALDPNGNAELDGNIYNGTPEQFAAEFGGVVVTPPPPTGEPNMNYYQASGNITMRQAGNASAPVATLNGKPQYVYGYQIDRYEGDVLETEAPINGFVKILRLWRNGAWVQVPSLAYCGTAYLKTIAFTPPPDPVGKEPRVVSSFATFSQTIVYDDGTQETFGAQNVELK